MELKLVLGPQPYQSILTAKGRELLPVDEQAIYSFACVCKLLTDCVKQSVLVKFTLLGKEQTELSVTDLAAKCGVAQPTMSHHLSVLKLWSLVDYRDNSMSKNNIPERFYRIAPEAAKATALGLELFGLEARELPLVALDDVPKTTLNLLDVPARVTLLAILARGDIASTVDILPLLCLSQPTVSRHLTAFRTAGWIREGKKTRKGVPVCLNRQASKNLLTALAWIKQVMNSSV